MTPLQIQIALHYHCSASDFRDMGAPAIREALGWFVAEGLLVPTHAENGGTPIYGGTNRLAAYVAELERVSLPVAVWVSPEAAAKLYLAPTA